MFDSGGRTGTGDLERKTGRRLWYTVIFVAAALVIVLFLYKAGVFKAQPIEQRLAAIETDRAVPDEENAAIVYDELLETYNLTGNRPAFFTDEMDAGTLDGPWSAVQYPKVAAWLKTQQPTVKMLLEAADYEKCRFPIELDLAQQAFIKRSTAYRGWAMLLLRAGNYDLGRGNTDAALEKYLAIIEMVKHLYQQPTFIEYLVGAAIEMLGEEALIGFIIESKNEAQLRKVEENLPSFEDKWTTRLTGMQEVENLIDEYNLRHLGFFRRIGALFSFGSYDAKAKMHDIYLRLLSKRRGVNIVIAIVSHKQKHGEYPNKLKELTNISDPKILIDPTNGGEFVYERAGSKFRLYSKGLNGIDDGGRRKLASEDDYPIWMNKQGNEIKGEQ